MTDKELTRTDIMTRGMSYWEARVLRLNELHTVKTCGRCSQFTGLRLCEQGHPVETTSFRCFGR